MPEVGDVVDGRYEIESLLGRGGMATVYRAVDQQLGRTVAMKFFGAAEAPGAAAQRATSEVRLLASLNHPSLVTLFDARVDEADRTYLVMELVEGPTLQQLLDEGPVAPAAVATMVADLAEGLHVAHERGVVHRDVKPANVLLAPLPGPQARYRAKLADFGIAYLVDSTRVTATGTLMGTAAFVSPEQAQGHPVGPPSDVYSLGLVALEALTGERAFGGTMVEQLTARLLRSPEVPGGLGSGWKALLTAMTATDPATRPDALEVARRAREVGDVPEDGGATALLDAPAGGDTATRVLPAGAAIAGGAAAAGLAAGGAGAAAAAEPATTAYPTGAAPTPFDDTPTERYGATAGAPFAAAGPTGAGAGADLADDRDAAGGAGGTSGSGRGRRAGLVVALVLVALLLVAGVVWAVVATSGDDAPAPAATTPVESTEPAPEVTSDAPVEEEPAPEQTQEPAPTQPAPPVVTPTAPTPEPEPEPEETDEDEQDEDESPVVPTVPEVPTTGNGNGGGNGQGPGTGNGNGNGNGGSNGQGPGTGNGNGGGNGNARGGDTTSGTTGPSSTGATVPLPGTD
ncbi:hypothetical protein GCM10027282_19580 [Frigoribacterium salinisoli]